MKMANAHFTPRSHLPSLEEVQRLWNQYGMLDNIREHSRVVGEVATAITDWLDEAGVRLRRDAVHVGALLHDIAKTQCLGTSRRHDQEGEQLLRQLGHPELGYVVGVHVRLPDPHPVDEAFVVYYADKRVRHTAIVDLDERFDYIAERYGKDDHNLLRLIERGRLRAVAAERQLFGLMRPGRTPQAVG